MSVNDRDKIIEAILDGDMPMVAGKMSKSGVYENIEYVPLQQTVDRLIGTGFGSFERSGVYRWSGGFEADDDAVIENGEVLYRRRGQ